MSGLDWGQGLRAPGKSGTFNHVTQMSKIQCSQIYPDWSGKLTFRLHLKSLRVHSSIFYNAHTDFYFGLCCTYENEFQQFCLATSGHVKVWHNLRGWEAWSSLVAAPIQAHQNTCLNFASPDLVPRKNPVSIHPFSTALCLLRGSAGAYEDDIADDHLWETVHFGTHHASPPIWRAVNTAIEAHLFKNTQIHLTITFLQ